MFWLFQWPHSFTEFPRVNHRDIWMRIMWHLDKKNSQYCHCNCCYIMTFVICAFFSVFFLLAAYIMRCSTLDGWTPVEKSKVKKAFINKCCIRATALLSIATFVEMSMFKIFFNCCAMLCNVHCKVMLLLQLLETQHQGHNTVKYWTWHTDRHCWNDHVKKKKHYTTACIVNVITATWNTQNTLTTILWIKIQLTHSKREINLSVSSFAIEL